MSVLVQLIFQIGLPAFLLIDVLRRKYRSRRDWLIDIILVSLVLLFVFLTARWDWFSYYLRILLIPMLGLVTYASFRCIERLPPEQRGSLTLRKYIEYGIKGMVVLVMLYLNGRILSGYFTPPGAVELAYPLRSGVYYVGGGGNSQWINAHHAHPPQNYALDIVRLNATGNRAWGILPDSLSRYTIFGDRVHSPCEGIVARAVDGYPDLIPPERDTEQIAGNHLVILCKGVQVVLAHLQNGSIVVQEGEAVIEGEVVGQVGNSGNSSQPHLHIHAERGGDSEVLILAGEGVPIRFEGRFMVRNSLFTGR